MHKKVLAIVGLLVLAGCQTPQAVPPSETPAAPEPGVPHRADQPALPPIYSAGPLTRAAVGTYMDSQEADLRSYLRGQGVLVSRRGDALAVTLQSDRLFDHGEISDWGDAFLRAMVQVLAHYDHTLIEVNGYSDAAATPDAAVATSQKRAKAVADGLSRYGVAAGRLTVNGLGATNLRVANASDPKNRRIEIKITPNPKYHADIVNTAYN
jgi:outer membrane protein OmpA-like peptidoglycan-associated protein